MENRIVTTFDHFQLYLGIDVKGNWLCESGVLIRLKNKTLHSEKQKSKERKKKDKKKRRRKARDD